MWKKLKEKMKQVFQEQFKFWEVIILMGLTAIIGVALGGFVVKENYGIAGTPIGEPLQDFISNYNYILNNYYGDLDEEALLKKALEGILEEIDDPYAVYMDEAESSNFDIQLSGSYEGLGVEVGSLVSNGQLIITQVFDNSPAQRVGLQAGDIITKINGENIGSMNGSDFSTKIKQMKGQFALTVMREDNELTFDVSLETVVLTSVTSEMLDNNIGYMYISIFAENTFSQMKAQLEQLEKDGMQSLIIDVRSNTGGYLTSVENILGLFLDSSHVIYQTEDKTGIKKYYSKGDKTKTYPIVIITNSSSASASEILTAALKEELGAKSVGKDTYGKGTAQKVHSLSDGSKYKFTTQKWLTPSGQSIDGQGVKVDVEVSLTDAYYENPTRRNDTQFQEALSLIQQENIFE